jgi:hypothetical protein
MGWYGMARPDHTNTHPIILHEGFILHMEFLTENVEFNQALG